MTALGQAGTVRHRGEADRTGDRGVPTGHQHRTVLTGGLHVVDAMVVPQLGEHLDVAFPDHPEGGCDALIDECLSKGRMAGDFVGHSGYRTMHRSSESPLPSRSSTLTGVELIPAPAPTCAPVLTSAASR